MKPNLKTIVIIGGDRGIGAATATLAAQKGYQVVLGFYEQALTAQAKVHEINTIGAEACAFQLDVADVHSVELFFDRVVATYGIPDAVVNCAAISGHREALIDMMPQSIARILATNLNGAFHCVQVAAKHMAISRGGRGGAIVTLSSEITRFGGNLLSPYAASKAGINTLTLGVARELAKEGIRLNAVSPGVIVVPAQGTSSAKPHADDIPAILQIIPMGRLGLPVEVAQAILWLLSSEAAYVTGTVLAVAGGR